MAKAQSRISHRELDDARVLALASRDPGLMVTTLLRRPMAEVELGSVPTPGMRRLRSPAFPLPDHSEIVFRRGAIRVR